MNLTVADRLQVPSFFQEKAGIDTLLLQRGIREKLSLSDEEKKQINFRVEGNRFLWDNTEAPEVDVELTEAELEYLRERVRELSKQGSLIEEQLDLVLKLRNTES